VTPSIEPLKKTLHLGEGETGTGFACRVATLWRAPSSTIFWEDVGIPFNSIAKGEESAIRALADVTGADFGELRRWSPVWLDRGNYRLGDELVSRTVLVRGRFRLCPECAVEDMAQNPHLRHDQAVHGRLVWQFMPIATCHRHSRSLVEIVSDLPARFDFHDFGLRVGDALLDLDRLMHQSRIRPTSACERYCQDRLEGKSTDVPLLDKMRLHHVAGGSLVFGRVSLFGPKRRQADLTEHEIYLAREEGFRILAEGPPAIRRLFERLMVESSERLTRSHTITGTLGHIIGWLEQSLGDDTDRDELRTIVARQAFSTFPGAGGETLFGVTNSSPPMLTVHDVERRYGVDWVTATRVATLAGVLRHIRAGDAPGPRIIAAEDAERLFAKFVDVVSVTVLAHEIGATQKQLVALADAGILKPAFDAPGVVMSFRRSDVDALLGMLTRNATPVVQRDTSMVSIRRAAWRSAPKFIELVRRILDGDIGWLGRLPQGRLLEALVAERDEVGASFVRPAPVDGTVSVTDLCARWKVKSEAVVGLVERRRLAAVQIGGRGRRYRIRWASAESFERTHISVQALALLRNQDWKTVKPMVERHEISRAFPGLRGCFYLRDELERANLI